MSVCVGGATSPTWVFLWGFWKLVGLVPKRLEQGGVWAWGEKLGMILDDSADGEGMILRATEICREEC